MRKGVIISSLLLSTALVLSGCGNDGDNNVRPNANGPDGVGTNNYRSQGTDWNGNNGNTRNNGNNAGNNNNSRMEMSDRIAEKVASMPGVDAAYVMMTDRNAYVAIVQSRNGANGSGMNTNGDRKNGGNNQGRSNAKSSNGNNGRGTGGSDVAADLKDRIADRVKAMSPSTRNVYVTANPDFVTRMQTYAQEIGEGHPIRGFMNEFNALVQRMFPEASGTDGPDNDRAGTKGGSRTSGMGGLND